MNKNNVKTIEKLTDHLHNIYEVTSKTIESKNVVEKFDIELIKDAKQHLELLREVVITASLTEEGKLIETLALYVRVKSDTMNEILALELLLYDKQKRYQEMLIKSNREYAKLSDLTDNALLRSELRKDLADEIFNFKNYLNELFTLADQKRIILSKKLQEAQETNRELVEMLEKSRRRNQFTNIVTGKFAFS